MKILIITTINDLSIPLFLMAAKKLNITCDFLFYEQKEQDFKNIGKSHDHIYMRDPFNHTYDIDHIKNITTEIIHNTDPTKIIDNLDGWNDFLMEDKWIQHQSFGKYMAKTALCGQDKSILQEPYIIKKRISSRASGIHFDIQEINPTQYDQYIIQEQITGTKEYRIYIIYNNIMPIAGIKSIKTKTQKVKVIGAEKIPEKLKKYAQSIANECKYDFIGLDVMVDENNTYTLIEINRSCLFGTYYKHTAINLAEVFLEQLMKH